MTNPDKHMPEEIFADGNAYKEGHLQAWHTCHSGCIRYVRADLVENTKDKSK